MAVNLPRNGTLLNILPNPSFEVNSSGWKIDSGWSRVSTDAKFGTYSYYIAQTSGFPNLYNDVGEIPVRRNTNYVLSCYAKCTKTSGGNPFIALMDENFTNLVQTSITDTAGLWVRFQCTVSSGNRDWIRIKVNPNNLNGNVFVDGFQLEEGTVATDYKDGDQTGYAWEMAAHGSPTVSDSSPYLTVTTPPTIRSVDTMKESRDDTTLTNTEIDYHVALAATMNVTHITVDTNYSNPTYIKRWADSIHAHGKSVWFRLLYTGTSTTTAITSTLAAFIAANPTIFEDGDIFDPIIEIGASGYGLPGTRAPFNTFIRNQINANIASFAAIGKNVDCKTWSMNRTTILEELENETIALMGKVTNDSYPEGTTTDPATIEGIRYRDMSRIYNKIRYVEGAVVQIGEWGYDSTSNLSDNVQAAGFEAILYVFSLLNVYGMNYWSTNLNVGATFYSHVWTGSKGNWVLRPSGELLKAYYEVAAVETPPADDPTLFNHVYRGVNTAGLEFSGSYQAITAGTMNYIEGKGFDIVRIPFKWEELQPNLSDDFDTAGLAFLDEAVDLAEAEGLKVVLDMHNYGRRIVYLDGGWTDDFDQSSQNIFYYPYGDHSQAQGTVTLRDYGRGIAGTINNPVSPAAGYNWSFTFTINSITNSYDEIQIESYYTNEANRYALYMNPTLSTWSLRRVIGGVSTTLASGTKSLSLATEYDVIVDVNQATSGKINISIDGTPLYTTDSVSTSATLTGGYVAIMPNDLNVSIKDMTLNVAGDTTSGGPEEKRVTDSGLPIEAWNDFWERLSDVYKDNTTVIAYDHNEPYSMPIPTSTLNYSQAVADANAVPVATNTYMIQQMLNTVRANGDNKFIVANYDNFANAHRHTELYTADPLPWITDTITPYKVIFSAHYYPDSNHSGANFSLPVRTLESITEELTPAFAWAKQTGVKFLLGEVGVPSDANWTPLLEHIYDLADQYDVWVTYWALGDYYTSETGAQPTSSFTVDTLQMPVMELHPGYAIEEEVVEEPEETVGVWTKQVPNSGGWVEETPDSATWVQER